MPNAITIAKLTNALATTSADDLLPRLREAGDLVSAVEELAQLEAHEVEYLRAIPSPLLEAMRGAAIDTLAGGRPVQVQFEPAYEFGVTVFDFVTAVAIRLSGPYPPGFRADPFAETRTG